MQKGELIPGSGDLTEDGDGGTGQNSRTVFTPEITGVYYIEATAISAWTGTYLLLVSQEESNESAVTPLDPTTNTPATGAPSISGNSPGGRDADGGHFCYRRRRRAYQRFLQLPVDCRRDGPERSHWLHLHPDCQRAGERPSR